MNPELRQQLALQLPPKRLMVFPLVLLVVMTAIYWTAPLVLAFMMLIHWAVDAILFIVAAIVSALIGDARLLPSILKASTIALIAGALLHAAIFRVQLQLVQWGHKPLSRGGVLALLVVLVVMLWIGLRVAT